MSTERDDLIKQSLEIAGKGVQVNDDHVYQVPARDLVLYAATIRALVSELQEAPGQALRDYAKNRYEAFLEQPDVHWADQKSPLAQQYARAMADLRKEADRLDAETRA